MPKPYPDIVNVSNAQGIWSYAHTVTNGIITNLVVAAIAIVLFILFKARFSRSSEALLASSVLTLTLSVFIWAMGFLEGPVLLLLLIVAVAALFWTFFEQ